MKSQVLRAEFDVEMSPCTRCGRRGRSLVPFPEDEATRQARLCRECREEWEELLRTVAHRWHGGLVTCFFCRRELGNHLFPARSPFGTSCVECGLTLSALESGGVLNVGPRRVCHPSVD